MPVIVESNPQRQTLNVVGDLIVPLLSCEGFELFELTGPADSGPPPHRHDWDEGYVVLDGELLIGGDDGEHRAGPGAQVTIPRGQLHWYRILSPTTRFLVVTSGTGAGRFFRDADANVGHGAPTPQTLPDLITVAKRNGLTSPLFD